MFGFLFAVKYRFLQRCCRQLDNEVDVVGLDGCLVRGTVSANRTAFIALLIQDIAAPCIRLGVDGAHDAAAGVLSIAGQNVNVE